MSETSIYGIYELALERVLDNMLDILDEYQAKCVETMGSNGFEHITYRIKSDDSMREKIRGKGLPENEESALVTVKDAIGIRVICSFVDDVFEVVDYIRNLDNIEIIDEKDYIRHAKTNGYRSYHMILAVKVPLPDLHGDNPGTYYVELQVRTIAMDTWASLEHKMKYKKDIANQELLVAELKRVADELASCDLSMQTIHDIIKKS
jgi:ppGpp synthetase/RelA/SpoT-type nucleotidyltranferase